MQASIGSSHHPSRLLPHVVGHTTGRPARHRAQFQFCCTSSTMKERQIEEAIDHTDVWRLRELAILNGGLLNDSLRRRAYWILLSDDEMSWESSGLSEHDRQAVRWDVERCDLTSAQKRILVHVIEQSCAFYCQGYHQIANRMLQIFDTEECIYILRRLYMMHFGKYVANDDLPIVRLVQLMGPPMLCHFDPELYQVIEEYTFSVSYILTWFAACDNAPCLFDAFVASHTLLPLYMSFALLMEHKPLILEEPMNTHKPLPIKNPDTLVTMAIDLMAQIPPNQRLWLVTSHYYGDGAVEDLLTTAASNSLLRLAAPESSSQSLSLTTSPRACIAAGMGRPKHPKYKRLVAWLVAWFASLCWVWRKMKRIGAHDSGQLSPPPLVNEAIGG